MSITVETAFITLRRPCNASRAEFLHKQEKMAARFLHLLDFPGRPPPDTLRITSAWRFGAVANGWTVMTADFDFGIVITPATHNRSAVAGPDSSVIRRPFGADNATSGNILILSNETQWSETKAVCCGEAKEVETRESSAKSSGERSE